MNRKLFVTLLSISLTITLTQEVFAMDKKIVLLNPFQMKPGESENFLRRWNAVAEYMKRQPGFISAKLHQGVSDESLWVNYAEWRSAEDFGKAVQSDEFKRLTKDFPGEGKPNLYRLHTKIGL